MITHDLRWSLPRGNPPVPSRWQATGVLRFSPACLRMLRSVPGGKTALSLPATVTRPGLAGCL